MQKKMNSATKIVNIYIVKFSYSFTSLLYLPSSIFLPSWFHQYLTSIQEMEAVNVDFNYIHTI